MWMRDRRDGPGIHADASGTEGSDAGVVEGMHWPQFRAKARPIKLIFRWVSTFVNNLFCQILERYHFDSANLFIDFVYDSSPSFTKHTCDY